MTAPVISTRYTPFLNGIREALPLLGSYLPIAMSFGLIAIQTGFSAWEAVFISTVIYAGGSQFLFVGMIASGAPLWLVVTLSLLINARHMVYGPNIAPWVTDSRWWPWLVHGLTDQVFAMAYNRMPDIPEAERVGWFSGVMITAWAGWITGTAVGALGGEQLMSQWPLFGEVAAFALPALLLVLLAPLVTSFQWLVSLCFTTMAAIVMALTGYANLAIPLSALLGAACFYAMKDRHNRSVR